MTWFNIGNVVGSQILLWFTLIFKPGKWLFQDFSFGQAMALYAFLGVMLIVGTGAAFCEISRFSARKATQ